MQDELQKLEADFIFIGSGNKDYENLFIWLSNNTANIRTFVGYDGNLANLLYAGSDFFLMPSKFEPCGLSQLIAMRYGSLPIVRATGGLEDSVIGYPLPKANGFKFWDYEPNNMMNGVRYAIGIYKDKKTWKNLVKSAMSYDYSWEVSAKKYMELFNNLLKG